MLSATHILVIPVTERLRQSTLDVTKQEAINDVLELATENLQLIASDYELNRMLTIMSTNETARFSEFPAVLVLSAPLMGLRRSFIYNTQCLAALAVCRQIR